MLKLFYTDSTGKETVAKVSVLEGKRLVQEYVDQMDTEFAGWEHWTLQETQQQCAKRGQKQRLILKGWQGSPEEAVKAGLGDLGSGMLIDLPKVRKL